MTEKKKGGKCIHPFFHYSEKIKVISWRICFKHVAPSLLILLLDFLFFLRQGLRVETLLMEKTSKENPSL